jgi:hypothetical protein
MAEPCPAAGYGAPAGEDLLTGCRRVLFHIGFILPCLLFQGRQKSKATWKLCVG